MVVVVVVVEEEEEDVHQTDIEIEAQTETEIKKVEEEDVTPNFKLVLAAGRRKVRSSGTTASECFFRNEEKIYFLKLERFLSHFSIYKHNQK